MQQYRVAFFFLLQGLCAGTWAAQIPAAQVRLGLNYAQLGWILLAASTATLVGLPLAGHALSRWRLAWAMPAGAAMHALALWALGLAAHAWSLSAALFFFGLANSWVQVAVNREALWQQVHSERSTMPGYHGCWSAAAAAAALLDSATGMCGLPRDRHLQAVALGMLAVVVAFAVASKKMATLPPPPTGARPATVVPRLGEPRLHVRLRALGLATALAMGLEAICFDWGGVLYRQALAAHATSPASLGYGALMLGMTGGRLVAHALTAHVRPSALLALLGTLAAGGLWLAVACTQPAWMLMGMLLQGLGLSAIVPLLLGGCASVRGMSCAQALAWTSTLGAIGALVGPTTLGWAAQAVGLRPALGGAALLALAVVMVGVPPLKRSPLASP